MTKRRSAEECIAFLFGSDIADIRDSRYQPTRYSSPAVFVVGNDYYCAPTKKQKVPAGWNWKARAFYYGREIYEAAPE